MPTLNRNILILFLTALMTASPFAKSEPVIPSTPAGTVLAAWLDALNSGDVDQIRTFTSRHENDEEFVRRRLRTHRITGGFKLLRIEKSDPMRIVAYVEVKKAETIQKLDLTLKSLDPPKLDKLIIQPTVRPADLQLPKLTQAEAIAALSAKADELTKQDGFSGAVLIARNGNILFQKSYGFSNRETKAPVTLDTQFRIGSMNKMFTAIAMLQLVESGKVSLDDVLGKYLADYPNKEIREHVTIRHLLSHTGGTGDIFSEEYFQRLHATKEHTDYVNIFGARAPLFEPGSRFDYSNYGYVLLGRLIEVISGMSYYDYVEKMVFTPAGMQATASLPESEIVPPRAIGYMWQDGKLISTAEILPYRGTSAGGGYSTVGDLLKFSEALNKGKLISMPLLAEATRLHTETYGYGFGISGDGKLRRYGHGGGFSGMNGVLHIYPEIGYVLVSLSNFDPPTAEWLVDFFENRMPLN